MKPSRVSGCESRSRTTSIVRSSGTRSPASMIGRTRSPSGVPAATAARYMSPVLTCGMPSSCDIRCPWVPLPAPGGPRMTMFRPTAALFEEALVVAHHHLRLHLPHGVEGDADHDEDRCSAERPVRRLREAAVADEQRREGRDEREE